MYVHPHWPICFKHDTCLQVFFAPLLHATRALTGKSVPIFNWATGSSHAILRLWGPASLGGQASLFSTVIEESIRTGEDPDDLGNKVHRMRVEVIKTLFEFLLMSKVYKQTTGAVVRIPGLPPMFDHEFFPQEVGG